MHSVARQNKLETPKEKDEVNKREVHECDVRTRDPDEMVVPQTPKSTWKVESLSRAPTTITSSCEGNTPLKKCNSYVARDEILKLKQKSEAPQQRPRSHVSTRISTGHPPHPNHTPTHHTNAMGESTIQM